jgi:phosphatidylinositol-3-phosphatase
MKPGTISQLGRLGLVAAAVAGALAFACSNSNDTPAPTDDGGSSESSSGSSGTSGGSSGTSGGSSGTSGGSSGTSGGSSGTSGGSSGTSGGSSGDSGASGDSGNNDSGTDAGTDPGTDAGSDSGNDSGTVTKLKTVFTLVFENHDYKEIVGVTANAPYFNSLIAKYGLATNYSDSLVHPSLPNYLTMISGDPQYGGVVDYNPTDQVFLGPKFPVDKPNLGTQLIAQGIPWRSYQESMGAACTLTDNPPYAPKHDPFLYFQNIQLGANGVCANTNVDYNQFPADVAGNTYRYVFITPNLNSDGHDPSGDPVAALKFSDAWAHTEIDKIMATTAYKDGGVIFITWDEAENRSGAGSADQIPMIVVSESIKAAGYTSSTKYSHKSYLATVEDILGLPRLATVANEPSMMEFFK